MASLYGGALYVLKMSFVAGDGGVALWEAEARRSQL